MMVSNLFSMFDPSSSFLAFNWLVAFTIILLLKNTKDKKMSKTWSALKNIMMGVNKEIEQLMEKKIKTTKTMFSVLFVNILILNLVAIFPYNFTVSAHISVSFTLSMSMWLSTMVFGWVNNFKSMMIHMTPMGTPNPLMNFMVVIEMISAIIRPVTLSIRLSANMVAGHLLMSLLSTSSMTNMNSLTMSMIPTISLIVLEVGVAIVQAYVLITLLLLYQNETV